MFQHPPITLRYFDCRGRGQFLRLYFAARGVEYQDERVALSADFSAWRALRTDRARTGPFQKLPVLGWGDQLVAETLVIRDFLHQWSGDAARLSATGNLRHAMLASSAYSDLSVPVIGMIWSEVLNPGVDLAKACQGVLERLQVRYLPALEQSLVEWDWNADLARRPVMLADCQLWEALDTARIVLHAKFDLGLYPALAEFYGGCPGRAAFQAALAARPCPITGRPNEAEALPRIQAAFSA